MDRKSYQNMSILIWYSFDIKKCEDSSYYSPKYHEKTAVLLAENNGFFPSITKRKDGHFLNPLHILEYCNKLKIPGYDAYCSSINADTYKRQSLLFWMWCVFSNAFYSCLT
jgi:hypothetical protein